MELVTVQFPASRSENRVTTKLRLNVADHLQFAVHLHDSRNDSRHRMFFSLEVHEFFHQVHIAAAFGINGHTCCRRLSERTAHRRIRRQFLGKHLRKAPT